MSKKKIKAPRVKVKKPKMNPFMMQQMHELMMGPNTEKLKRKREDADKVTDLILEGTLDPYKIEDYKHVKSVARTLDWSAHRMFKAIELADVAQMVKNEEEVMIVTPEKVKAE